MRRFSSKNRPVIKEVIVYVEKIVEKVEEPKVEEEVSPVE